MSEMNNIMDVVNRLAKGETLDDAIKVASDTAPEVTEESTDEEKIATSEEEAQDNNESVDNNVDLDKLASKVAAILSGNVEETGDLDKVAALVEEYNAEFEKLSESQEYILSTLFNAACVEDGNATAEDIVKMASEEDSVVPYLMQSIYKYAEAADAMLAEKYDEDYNEDDVIKLAAILIDSEEDPFGLEAFEAEEQETKEAEEEVEVSEEDAFAEKVAKKLFALAKENQ